MTKPGFPSPTEARATAKAVASHRRSIRAEFDRDEKLAEQARSDQVAVLFKRISMDMGHLASLFEELAVALSDDVQVADYEQFQSFDPVGKRQFHSGSPDPVCFQNPTAAAEAAHRLSENRK